MRFLLGIFRWFSAMLLHLSIFFIIGAFSFVFLLGNPQHIKDLLVESEIYNKFVNSVIDANLEQTNSELNTLPLDDQNVRTIINQSFPPTLLKDQTEAVIDDIYAWLDGTEAELSFAFDFTRSKEVMNNGIAEYAASRVLSLPECTGAAGEINVFTVDCKPAGFSYEFVRTQVLADLEQTDFLSDTMYTETDLPADGAGNRVYDRYSFAPAIFQLLQGSIYISIAVFMLLAGFFVYLRRPLNRGFQVLGRDLLSNGFMIILLTVVFGLILPRYTNAFGVQGEGTSALFNRVADLYVQRLDIIVINVAIQIAALGLGIILLVRINRTVGGYRNARVKSGITSSIAAKKTGQKGAQKTKRPPLQTSEVDKKKKSKSRKSKKYRKMGL